MRKLWPRSFALQTVLVLLIGLTVSHVLSVVIYSNERVDALSFTGGRQMAHRIAEIVRLVEETPAEWEERILQAVSGPTFDVSLSAHPAVPDTDRSNRQARVIGAAIAQLAGVETVRIEVLDTDQIWTHARSMHGHMALMMGMPGGDRFQASVQLSDGRWANFGTIAPEPPPLWSFEGMMSLVLMVVAVALLSMWAARRMTRPLRLFASAAERLGRDVMAPPLAETGPDEVREAVRAFNRMQDNLQRLVRNRTEMLAAISHDMRTPITTLRLRAEFIEDEEERAKTLETLSEMEAMIASTLAFARDDADSEDSRVVDFAALLRTICDDLEDLGQNVTFEGPERLSYLCRSGAMRRATANLIENAVKYGGCARVALAEQSRSLNVIVDDDGPGIPENELEAVFQPFHRVEASRSTETGGVGLGLSIARGVVDAHGGEIRLENRAEGGLRATVTLPR